MITEIQHLSSIFCTQ